ncbi:hypothetical protein Syun_017210 [Stephania yunnanensis]|uniref:Uncharacterized protein n=1 Tax=Stephania yunnanensis TaxID=152371 RepID=A0AAP0J6M0_9MAGN
MARTSKRQYNNEQARHRWFDCLVLKLQRKGWGHPNRLMTWEEVSAIPVTGTRGGLRRLQTTSYRKAGTGEREIQRGAVGNGDSGRETSRDVESEGSSKGEEKGSRGQESEGSEEVSQEEDLEESSGTAEEGNGEGEEEEAGESSEGASEDEEERTRDKAHGKQTSSCTRVVKEATDEPSRPIPSGCTDHSMLASFNNHVAAATWKNEVTLQ